MSGPEISATQGQLRKVYDATRLALPELVPARDEENKIFNGQIPTESTSLFLSWGVELTPEQVHAIDPRAIALLHAERGLEIFYFGPESRDQSSVEFCAPRDPASGYELTRWIIERHDDDPNRLLHYRRSRLAKAFRQEPVDTDTLSGIA